MDLRAPETAAATVRGAGQQRKARLVGVQPVRAADQGVAALKGAVAAPVEARAAAPVVGRMAVRRAVPAMAPAAQQKPAQVTNRLILRSRQRPVVQETAQLTIQRPVPGLQINEHALQPPTTIHLYEAESIGSAFGLRFSS